MQGEGKGFGFTQDFGAAEQGADFFRAEIRLQQRGPVLRGGKRREQFFGDGLTGKVPDDGAKFVFRVKANAVINGVEAARAVFKEDVAALAVGVVDEQIEKRDGFEQLLVLVCEIEVVIAGVVFDELLERARAVGTVFAQRGERDDVKAKRLADDVRGDLAQRQCAFLEIPERLFAARGFIHGGIFFSFVRDLDEKRVIRAKHELTLDLKVAVLEGLSKFSHSVRRLETANYQSSSVRFRLPASGIWVINSVLLSIKPALRPP